MQKRERLERAIAGEDVDRPPVALWRHWPGDDQRSADLARSTVDFQHDYNWDFVRVMPSRNFQTVDYGAQDSWRGAITGRREITKRPVRRSLDWTQLRPLSPDRGALGRQLDCLRLIGDALRPKGTPVVQTVYSPLLQAAQLAGRDKVLRDLRLRPDRLRTGLQRLSESTLRFLERAAKLDRLSGIFLVAGFGSYASLSEAEFNAIARPPIETILDALPRSWWLNAVQVAGVSPMLRLVARMPFQVMQWDSRGDAAEMAEAKSYFRGAVCGGLQDRDDLLLGTPALLRSSIRQLLRDSGGRRLILAGGDSLFVATPVSNIRALRSIADEGL